MKEINKINQPSAIRLKQIRSLTGLNLSKFCSQNNLTYFTYRLWESGTTKLTEKNTTICCKIFKKYGIYCSVKWLLHGLGDAPKIENLNLENEYNHNIKCDYKSMALYPEMAAFSQSSSKAFVCKITNNDAIPYFNKNDLLGCVEVDDLNQLSKLDNYLIKYDNTYHIKKVCVVNGSIMVVPLRPNSDFEILTDLQDIEVLAKIVLHRVSCV